jgi:hypothetical protein
MGLWDMIRGAEKAQGGNYNPGIGKPQGGGLSGAALGAFKGLGIGKQKNGGGGRE